GTALCSSPLPAPETCVCRYCKATVLCSESHEFPGVTLKCHGVCAEEPVHGEGLEKYFAQLRL
ncbi:unnamed protein product, partial [Symbiodinium sp. CCMP2456]